MSRSALLALAAGLPMCAYVASVGPAGYWLDAGEFVAASTLLDIAHPPGHPLALLWGKLWTLLPLGPLAFRVGLGQAVATGGGAAFLFLAIRRSALAFGGVSESLAGAIALLGTWLPMLSYPLWFQAVRPEVYALHGALLLAAAHQLTRVVTCGTGDPRPLYAACLCVGLALANHHFTAIVFMPALLFVAAWMIARRGLRPLWTCAACGVLGLGVYAYLPARALTRPLANLGDPSTVERIYWVVSAKVYAREMGDEFPQPLAERLIDVTIALVEALHGPFVIAALAGSYFALRLRSARNVGVLWLLIAVCALYARAWVGAVRGNPDALGYIFAGIAAVAALAVLSLAALPVLLSRERPAAPWLTGASLALALGVGALQLHANWSRSSLSGMRAMESFDEARIEALPPRAVVVASSPSLVFRHFQHAAIDRTRPDVTLVPLPFLKYPGVADGLRRRDAGVMPLVGEYLRHEALRPPAMRALSARRPLLVELDLRVDPALYAELLPGATHLHALQPGGPHHQYGPLLQQRAQDRLYARLGASVHEIETSRCLLWIHYMAALHLAGTGDREAALEQVRRALALHPGDSNLARLQEALGAWSPSTSAFDVRPLLQLR